MYLYVPLTHSCFISLELNSSQEIIVGFRTPAQSFIDENRDHEPKDAKQNSDGPADEPVWRVSFKPGNGIEVRQLDDAEVREVQNGEERVGFLPISYFNKISQLSN